MNNYYRGYDVTSTLIYNDFMDKWPCTKCPILRGFTVVTANRL